MWDEEYGGAEDVKLARVEIFVLEQADNFSHLGPIRRGCWGCCRCSLASQL
jgi:hypothetical protein